MSATITQRPAAFAPVNNPVVYKFTITGGPFTLYRLVIGVYRESNNTLIGEMTKSPNLAGDILADVSSILKTVLYRDWDSSVEFEDNIGSIGFYIKHQEFYTGSATSPVDDVAAPRIAVLASRQIISNAVLTEYIPSTSAKKFLTMFDTMTMWRGYPFSLSFLIELGSANLFCWDEYNDESTIIKQNTISITPGEYGLHRAAFGYSDYDIHDDTKTIIAYLNVGYRTDLPSNWSNGFLTYDPFDSTTIERFIQNLFGADPVGAYLDISSAPLLDGDTPRNLVLNISGFVGTSPMTIKISFKNGGAGGTVTWESELIIPADTGAFEGSYEFIFDFLNSGDSDTITLTVVGFYDGVSDTVNILFNQQYYTPIFQRTEFKTILVEDPCDNPIYLFWKNSLGGDSFWLFDHSQELTWATDERKAKQLLLFAEGISANEFDAINEVNTIGQVFKNNIEELTDDVNKTSSRSDQQLYVIDEDGAKIGVINLTRNNTTQTRQVNHFIDVLIEYPELFL